MTEVETCDVSDERLHKKKDNHDSTAMIDNNNVNNTNKDEDKMTSCIVCWEDILVVDQNTTTTDETTTTAAIIKPCLHHACHACIHFWIERLEAAKAEEARCPHCRQIMDDDNVKDIMGRPFQRPPVQPTEVPLVDGMTQAWLQQNGAHECSICGLWMVRDENDGGNDAPAVMCLCGACYCWTCDEDAEECPCNHEEFYDNLTDMDVYQREGDESFRVRFPRATEEDLEDFGAFLERRQELALRDDEEEEEEEEPVVEESAETHLLALFEEYTEDAEAECATFCGDG